MIMSIIILFHYDFIMIDNILFINVKIKHN
jgi:hypothetical protein